jgi:type IV secretory pathway VirB10-like protein
MKTSTALLCAVALGCATNSSTKKSSDEHNAALERTDDVTRPSDPSLDPTAHEPAHEPPVAPAAPAGEPAPTSERMREPSHDRTLARNARTPRETPNAAAVRPETDDQSTVASERDPGRDKAPSNDTESRALTPLDQGNGEQDLRVTQEIRRAVIGDDALSFTAKNIKIITVDGKVTLRGAVDTESERKSLEAAARRVAGAKQVDSQLEVKR